VQALINNLKLQREYNGGPPVGKAGPKKDR